VAPFAKTSVRFADDAINKGHAAGGNESPAQGLAAAKVGRRVDSEAHEDVSGTVDDHHRVDYIFVGGEGWRLHLEERQSVFWAKHRVDAKADEDCREDAGADGKR